MTSPTGSSSNSAPKLHAELKKSRPDQATKKKIKKYLRQANELNDQGMGAQALGVIASALRLDKENKAAKQMFHIVCEGMRRRAKGAGI